MVRPRSKALEEVVMNYGVGRFRGPKVEFSSSDRMKIKRLIEHHTGQTVGSDIGKLSNRTRLEAATSNNDEKYLSASPKDSMVALRFWGCKEKDCSRDFHYQMRLAGAKEIPAERILVIENYEVFLELQLQDIGMFPQEGRTIVIYRGDNELKAGNAQELCECFDGDVYMWADYDSGSRSLSAGLRLKACLFLI